MACLPVNQESGKTVLIPAKASISFTKGDMLKDDGNGFITITASSQATDVKYIAAQTKTTGSTDGELLMVWPTDGIRFVCDTDANPAQTDVGTLCDWASVSTLNPDASTDDLFFIEKVVLPLSSKKVIGYFSAANES